MELDLGRQVGRDVADVGHDLVVDGPRVGDQLAVLLVGEQVAHDPHRELGLLVDDRGRLDLLGLSLDLVPLPDQPLEVVGDGLVARALGGGPHDHAVLLGLDLAHDRLQALALVVAQPAADARQALVRREHQEAARQRDLRGEAGALAAHRILRDLHEHGLARLQHLLDARRRPLEVLGAVVDLAGVEHAVAAAADVDEGRLHAGQHVLDAAQVDVAHHRGRTGAGDVVLDEHVLLEHRDLVAIAVLGDDHELVGEAGRRDDRLAPAPAAALAAPAPSGAAPGIADVPRGTARGHLLLDGHRLGLRPAVAALRGGLLVDRGLVRLGRPAAGIGPRTAAPAAPRPRSRRRGIGGCVVALSGHRLAALGLVVGAGVDRRAGRSTRVARGSAPLVRALRGGGASAARWRECRRRRSRRAPRPRRSRGSRPWRRPPRCRPHPRGLRSTGPRRGTPDPGDSPARVPMRSWRCRLRRRPVRSWGRRRARQRRRGAAHRRPARARHGGSSNRSWVRCRPAPGCRRRTARRRGSGALGRGCALGRFRPRLRGPGALGRLARRRGGLLGRLRLRRCRLAGRRLRRVGPFVEVGVRVAGAAAFGIGAPRLNAARRSAVWFVGRSAGGALCAGASVSWSVKGYSLRCSRGGVPARASGVCGKRSTRVEGIASCCEPALRGSPPPRAGLSA